MLNSAGDHIFTIAPIEVALDRRLSLEQIRVLLALFSFRDKQTGLVFPKRESIAARCGYTPKKISEITSSLVRLGWLIKVGTGGRSAPCQYRLMAPETLTEKVTVKRQKLPASTLPSTVKTVPEWETVPESETVSESGDKTVPQSGDKTVPEWGTGKEQTSEQTRNRQCVADTPLPPVDALQTSARRRGEMSTRLRGMGVNVTTVDPHLCGWVDAEVTDAELDEAVAMARVHKPEPQRVPAAYLARIVEELVSGRTVSPIRPATGPPPSRRAGGYKTVEQQNREAAARARVLLFGDKSKVIEGEVIRD